MIEKIIGQSIPKQQPNRTQKITDLLRYSKDQTLKIAKNNSFIETDDNFILDVKKIITVRQSILKNIVDFRQQQITDEQCDEIDYRANLHSQANSLNTNTNANFNIVDDRLKCKCGCKKVKGEKFSIFASDSQMELLGPSTLLFFKYFKFMIFCLFTVILIYGVFSLVTNSLDQNFNRSQCQDTFCVIRRIISDETKYKFEVTSVVQNWLGVFACIIWIFLIRILKYKGSKVNQEYDLKFKTCSDIAIKIQNLPYGEYNEQELIEYLEKLFKKIEQQNTIKQQITNQSSNQFQENKYGMKSIQIIYNMQFSRRMIQQIFFLSLEVHNLLDYDDKKKQRNVVKQVSLYKSKKNKLIQTYEFLQDLRKKFLNDSDFRRKLSTTGCLIEFYSQKKSKQILKKYGTPRIGLIKQFQQTIKQKILNCCFKNSSNTLFKGRILSIQRAPQPSDIQWKNCEKRYSTMRIIIIHFVTILIVLISFGIISGLDYVQASISKDQQIKNLQLFKIINYLTSFVLMIVNKILWFSLFYLLQYEYNHTLTDKIISQMNKALFHMSINVIILPIVSSYIIRGKMYGTDGLDGIVLDYHISMATVGLIVRFLNPPLLIKKVILYIRCTRNMVIRFLTVKQNNHQKNTTQVNKLYEGDTFDVADYYVTIMGAIYHAIFFIQLQPVIIFIVTFMTVAFYWILKTKVIKYTKLPELTDQLIFENALSQANLVPMVYGIGNIVISFITFTVNPQRTFSYIQPILAIIISALAFINPKGFLNNIIQYFYGLTQKTIPQNKHQQNSRDQNYYSQSNSLTLLGFEQILMGSKEKTAKQELVKFCNSFFPADYEFQIIKLGEFMNKRNNQTTQSFILPME